VGELWNDRVGGSWDGNLFERIGVTKLSGIRHARSWKMRDIIN
jgi:hypothetical protein